MGRDLGKPVFVNADHTVAVYASRDAVPEWVMDPTIRGPLPGPRLLMFTAQEGMADCRDVEVTPSCMGLVKDQERGGCLLIAPRIVEPGSYLDDDEAMVYDRQRGRWYEASQVRDGGRGFFDWTTEAGSSG